MCALRAHYFLRRQLSFGVMPQLPMTIDDLAARECELAAEVAAVAGTAEEKMRALAQRGVFSRYAQIHAAYSALAFKGDREALKRAVFLQWYAVSEPPFNSGLLELDGTAATLTLARLNDVCACDSLDDEWSWMLPWYDAISDFFFWSRFDIPALQQWLRAHRSDAFPDRASRSHTLLGRGQLSAYWYRPDADHDVR